MDSRQRAKTAIRGFYPLIETENALEASVYQLAEASLSSGAGILQLREKKKSPADYLKSALQIAYLKIHNDFLFLLNGHSDLVAQVGADGVHLGEKGLSIGQARSMLGADKVIGASVHSVEAGVLKEQEGADYLIFGTIFPSSSKSEGHPTQGVERLSELCRSVSVPVVAVGGIGLERVRAIRKAGASGFAVVSPVMQSPNPAEAVRQFDQAWMDAGLIP